MDPLFIASAVICILGVVAMIAWYVSGTETKRKD